MFIGKKLITGLVGAILILMFAQTICAQTTTPAPEVNARLARLERQAAEAKGSADNAWMLTSAALVLMMTGPGLDLSQHGEEGYYWEASA